MIKEEFDKFIKENEQYVLLFCQSKNVIFFGGSSFLISRNSSKDFEVIILKKSINSLYTSYLRQTFIIQELVYFIDFQKTKDLKESLEIELNNIKISKIKKRGKI